MSHYSDDAELTSPIAVKLPGGESGVVTGKDALRAYFEKGLAAFPTSGSSLRKSTPESGAYSFYTED